MIGKGLTRKNKQGQELRGMLGTERKESSVEQVEQNRMEQERIGHERGCGDMIGHHFISFHF